MQKQYAEAAEAFNHSNSISKHDQTYLQLGKVYVLQGKLQEAVDTYLEALEYSPESAELLTTVGLLYLQVGTGGGAGCAASEAGARVLLLQAAPRPADGRELQGL